MNKPIIVLVSCMYIVFLNICITNSKAQQINQKNIIRAEEIFKRVLEAADKRYNRYPKLKIINKAGVWAKVKEDGTIRITQEAINFCFNNVSYDTGNSRLAFIFGHEMAHLANDDFWSKSTKNFWENSISPENSFVPYNNYQMEYKADYYGLLYSSMAGYDPKQIAGANKNFVEKWVKQSSSMYKDSDTHPDPEKRKLLLLRLIDKMNKDILLFNIGARLYQAQRYDDALDFFKSFLKNFPSREVLNNIGIINFYKALNLLAQYNEMDAYRFQLAALLDINTRAEKFIKKRNYNEKQFNKIINESITYLEEACKKDTSYIFSKINLSSAYILSKNCIKYKKAKYLLEEIISLEQKKELNCSPLEMDMIYNNLAIAQYLSDKNNCDSSSNKSNGFAIAANMLIKNVNNHNNKTILYNLGRLFFENNEKKKAKQYWFTYYKKNPLDKYNSIIKKNMNEDIAQISEIKEINFNKLLSLSPVKIGSDFEKNNKLIDINKTINLNESGIANSTAIYYDGEKFQALFLDDIAIYVEVKPDSNLILTNEMISGPNFKTLAGNNIYIHSNIMFDTKDNNIKKIVYY